MRSTAAPRTAPRRLSTRRLVATAFVAVLAAGCGSSGTHAGLTEPEARVHALEAGASVRAYGGLRLATLTRETAPNGEEYWQATLVDANGTRRACVSLSGNATRIVDCVAPDDSAPPAPDTGGTAA